MCILYFQSCALQENSNLPESKHDNNLFMHTEQKYKSVSLQENFNPNKHKDFYSSELQILLDNNTQIKRSQTTGSDSVMNTNIAPVWTYKSYNENIYTDGSLEFTSVSNLLSDENINAILSVGKASVDFNILPTTVTFSNGWMKMYNSTGELLSENMFPMPDMQEYVDSVAYYMALYREYLSTETKSGPADGAALLKMALCDLNQTNYVVQELGDNKILLIQSDFNNPSIEMHTILSDDLTITYQSDTYENKQLKSRITNTYCNSDKFVTKDMISGLIMRQPQCTITQTLLIRNGIPEIYTEVIEYDKNIVTIYLK